MTDKEKVEAIHNIMSWYRVTAGAMSSHDMLALLDRIHKVLEGKHVSREG